MVLLGANAGAPFGMAAFTVHNPDSHAVFLHRTEVQVLDRGDWRTESDAVVQVVHRQWPHLGTAALCEPGAVCTVATPWPEAGPWRVRLVYQPECRSARWIQRAWMVVRFLDTGFWKARQWDTFQTVEGPLVFEGLGATSPDPRPAPVSRVWDAPRLPSFSVVAGPLRARAAPVRGARTNTPR